MLAISPNPASLKKSTPNILPCSIKHNGAVSASKRYWAPTRDTQKDGNADEAATSTAYFRGRKLRGRRVGVPEGYRGVVLEKTEKVMPGKAPTAEELRRMEEDDEDDETLQAEKEVDVKMMEPVAEFDEVVVWGHELVPEDDDVYVKGVQEWIAFAEAMHAQGTQPTASNNT